jgi:hypothetical protein
MDIPTAQKNTIINDYITCETSFGDKSKLKGYLDNFTKLPLGSFALVDI